MKYALNKLKGRYTLGETDIGKITIDNNKTNKYF